MTSVSAEKRHAKNARRTNSRKRRRTFTYAGLVLAALVVTGGIIAVQLATRSSAVVEPPIGEGRVLGDPGAPVTIVEYADFQCPVCKRAAADLLPQLEREYVDKGLVKIEFRYFPFLGQESRDAAQAAEAAAEQGKFWEYYAALYNAQGRENTGALSYDTLLELASDVGLDVERFDATLASNANLEVVQADADTGRARGVNSTPTFFINDETIVGLQSMDTFRAAIDAALEEAGSTAGEQ
jgi:protein-disulfide isomerase